MLNAVVVLALAIPIAAVVVLVLALLSVPWWLGLIIGLVAGLAVAGLGLWYRLRRADRLVLDRVGAAATPSVGAERMGNLVQGLSLGAGVDAPELLVVDDEACNAMAVRTGGRNSIVATSGLVEALDVVELEGVVAELLVRLRNGDAEAATRGAALLGLPLIDGPLRGLLAGPATAGLGRLFPDDRDLTADRQAVALTRYPPGLLAALRILESRSLTPRSSSGGLRHMWLVDPVDRRAAVEPSSPSRADLDLRIDVLAEL